MGRHLGTVAEHPAAPTRIAIRVPFDPEVFREEYERLRQQWENQATPDGPNHGSTVY